MSGIPPKEAVIILKSLEQAKSKLILKSGLHATFLVTPPTTSIEPYWDKLDVILHTFYKEHPVSELSMYARVMIKRSLSKVILVYLPLLQAGSDVAEFLGVDMAQVIKYKLSNPNAFNSNQTIENEVSSYLRSLCLDIMASVSR